MVEKQINNLVLGLDISTKCIGIALFEDLGKYGDLKLLHHISPVVKPVPISKMEELFEKANIFENEFLNKYVNLGITKVIIEEPLLRSNNVGTIATLLRFNGMVSRSVYNILKVTPDYISSYDARAFAFPELMQVRTKNKKGEPYPEKQIAKGTPVLFGAYDWEVDKKVIVQEKVAELVPQINWLYDKKSKLRKESYDMADAFTAVLAYMRKRGYWN